MLVIKIGGGAAIGEGGYTNFAEDLADYRRAGRDGSRGNAEFSDAQPPARHATAHDHLVERTRHPLHRRGDHGRHADGLLRQSEQASRRHAACRLGSTP